MPTAYCRLILPYFLLTLLACEREVTVDLPRPDEKIVIEGYMEQDEYAYVFITKNAPYFETVDSASVMEMIVIDAEVVVSDGSQNDTLQLIYDPFQFPYLKYVGNTITGEVGKTYDLYINYENRSYSAKTTIPEPVQLDSTIFRVEEQFDSLGFLWFYFIDPDTIGNNYRLFTKRLGKDSIFVHPYPSVYEDKLFNAQPVEYTIYSGRDPNIDPEQYEEEYDEDNPWWAFKAGDVVLFKFCSIDAEHFDFWYTIELQAHDGNPFSSPTTVKTNMQGGALGIWGGYGVCRDTVICEMP